MKIRTILTIPILLFACTFQLLRVYAAEAQTGQVVSLIIWDTARNRAVRELRNGEIINIATFPNFSLVAKVSPRRVSSVVFSYQNNGRYRIENSAPYSLSSDSRGVVLPWDFKALGSKTVSVGVYSKPGGVGVRTSLRSYRFSIVNEPTTIAKNTSSPTNKSTYTVLPLSPIGAPARRLTVSGNYAYIAVDETGLVVVDISNPTAPFVAGRYVTPGFAMDVVVSGNYAYVTDDVKGFTVLDISNPANPSLVGSYDTGGAFGLTVSGNYAYIADFRKGLVVVDISTPECLMTWAPKSTQFS
jgi:hypothetical protein